MKRTSQGLQYTRGVALAMVLLVLSIVVMFTGAMVANHSSSIQLFSASTASKQAMLGAQGALDLAQLLLEHNRNLGVSKFVKETTNPTYGEMPEAIYDWIECSEIEGTHRIEGLFKGGEGNTKNTFSIEISNNLHNDSISSEGLQAHTARLAIESKVSAHAVRLEGILVALPLYDASAISYGDLNLANCTNWDIASNDIYRNMVRSRGKVVCPSDLAKALTTPGYYSPGASPMKFSKEGKFKHGGMLWAKGNIEMGDNAGSSAILDPNRVHNGTSELGNFYSATNGFAFPNSKIDYNIYDLKLEDLKTPPAATKTSLKPGSWTLQKRDIVVGHDEHKGGENGGTIQVWENVTADFLVHPNAATGKEEIYYSGEFTKNLKPGAYLAPDFEGKEADTVPISVDGSSMVYSFASNQFLVSPSANLESAGDFTVGVALSADRRPITPPELVFQTNSEGKGGYIHGTGSISFGGIVKGSGGIAATGNINVQAESAELTTTEKGSGLVMWSQGSVTLDSAGRPDLSFAGLIYSKHNVNIVNMVNGNNSRISNLKLKGALVAQSGQINLSQADKVSMTYEPSYLQSMTNGLPGTRARLSRVTVRQL